MASLFVSHSKKSFLNGRCLRMMGNPFHRWMFVLGFPGNIHDTPLQTGWVTKLLIVLTALVLFSHDCLLKDSAFATEMFRHDCVTCVTPFSLHFCLCEELSLSLSLSLCRRFTLLFVDEDGFWFNDVDYFDWPCTFSKLFLKNVYTGILVTPQTEIHTGILVAYVEYW